MPVPPENLLFVEQARCLFLRMVLFGELKPTQIVIFSARSEDFRSLERGFNPFRTIALKE